MFDLTDATDLFEAFDRTDAFDITDALDFALEGLDLLPVEEVE